MTSVTSLSPIYPLLGTIFTSMEESDTLEKKGEKFHLPVGRDYIFTLTWWAFLEKDRGKKSTKKHDLVHLRSTWTRDGLSGKQSKPRRTPDKSHFKLPWASQENKCFSNMSGYLSNGSKLPGKSSTEIMIKELASIYDHRINAQHSLENRERKIAHTHDLFPRGISGNPSLNGFRLKETEHPTQNSSEQDSSRSF